MGGCPPDPDTGDSAPHQQSESEREREAKRAEIVLKEGDLKCLSSVASSSSLDSLLIQHHIDTLHFKIPKSEAVDYVSTPEESAPGSLEDCKVGPPLHTTLHLGSSIRILDKASVLEKP